jgi:hypothetical protein
MNENIPEKTGKTELLKGEGTGVKCPSCGTMLPEDTVSQLLKKEEKEFAFLLVGVLMGAAIGVVGNFWVSFAIETLKSLIPEAQWLLTSALGLIVTTIVTIYVLIRMIRFAQKRIGIESKEGVKP